MHMNGHRGPVPAPDHTSILVDMSGRIGRLEGAVTYTAKAVDRIERRLDRHRIPLSEMMGPIVLAITVGAAVFGKISWPDALPTMLGLVGK
jgi:hypothetical protein